MSVHVGADIESLLVNLRAMLTKADEDGHQVKITIRRSEHPADRSFWDPPDEVERWVLGPGITITIDIAGGAR